MENRDVLSLIGSQVWVKVNGGEVTGKVESVPTPVPNADWQQAINLSMFSIRLENGACFETYGFYFSRIDEKPCVGPQLISTIDQAFHDLVGEIPDDDKLAERANTNTRILAARDAFQSHRLNCRCCTINPPQGKYWNPFQNRLRTDQPRSNPNPSHMRAL